MNRDEGRRSGCRRKKTESFLQVSALGSPEMGRARSIPIISVIII